MDADAAVPDDRTLYERGYRWRVRGFYRAGLPYAEHKTEGALALETVHGDLRSAQTEVGVFMHRLDVGRVEVVRIEAP